MTSLSWKHSLTRGAGWVLPILAGVICAPGAAQAGCGGHVYIEKTILNNTIAARDSLNTRLFAPIEHQKHPKPCSGPTCSRGPMAPLAPVPTVPSSIQEEWCFATSRLDFTPPDWTSSAFEPQTLRLVRRASHIFHPPRLVLSFLPHMTTVA